MTVSVQQHVLYNYGSKSLGPGRIVAMRFQRHSYLQSTSAGYIIVHYSSTEYRPVYLGKKFRDTVYGGQRSFSYQAPPTWNKLLVSIRHAPSASSFKSSLKTLLFSKKLFFSHIALR